MGIFFGFQSCLCAGSRAVFLQQKMKSSLSHYRKVQNTLLHSKRLSKVPQQKLEKCYLCSRDGEKSLTLQKSIENFITQQKVKKSQRQNKHSLQRHPLDFGLNICAQTGSSRMKPWSLFCESISPSFLLRKILD